MCWWWDRKPTLFRESTIVVIYAIALDVLMEWLSYLTKPTAFVDLTITEKLFLLLVPIFPLIFVFLCIHFLFFWLSGLIQNAKARTIVATFIPTFLVSCLVFLLIDNFTYTIFDIGVANTLSKFRYVYGLLFLTLFIHLQRRWFKSSIASEGISRFLFLGSFFLLIVSVGAIAYSWKSFSYSVPARPQASVDKPDILLLSADAMQADLWGLYGFKEKTTPFLSEFGTDATVFQNVFSNANRTSGSLASVVTGKYGTTTHKLHSAHFFKGKDSYEHLPGILRSLGYRTLQLGWRHHADAFHWNLLNSFDRVNSRIDFLPSFFRGYFTLEFQFIRMLIDRVYERALHVLGVEDINVEPGKRPHSESISESRRSETLLDFMQEKPGPVFAQVHFNWAIQPSEVLRFDGFIETIVNELKKINRYDNTIIVIYSDHGRSYRIDRRLPLLMKLPRKVPEENITANVQLIDIAPTVLDAINEPIPNWMEGDSLLRRLNRETLISERFCLG